MGENVFISGASRGIGREIARTLAKEGYNLAMCCANSIDSLKAYTESLCDEYGINAKAYQLDVSSESSWSEIGPIIMSEFNSIDIVINNAGISYVGLITDMRSEDWHNVISTNVNSLYYSTNTFLPGMVSRKSGRIINISSMWGDKGASCEVAYSTSKGAINSFTKSLAKEVAPSNIAVNALSPGVIDTDMNSCFSAEDMNALVEDIPANRLGTPTDVAEAVLSLLRMPTYLTGQVIGIDGGF